MKQDSLIQTKSALAHLDARSQQNLIERYYAGEKVADLIREFRVDCLPGKLWRLFPPEATGRVCPACGAALIQPRTTRSWSKWQKKPFICCSICEHEEKPNCACKNCVGFRQCWAEVMAYDEQDVIADNRDSPWRDRETNIEPSHLTVESAVTILSLVRSSGWIGEREVGELRKSAIPMTPQQIDMYGKCIDTLLSSHLVVPGASSEAFRHHNRYDSEWYLSAVKWILLMPNPQKFIHQLEVLAASPMDWPDGWYEGLMSIWRQLAKAECLEFCYHCLSERNLPRPTDVALSVLIDNLLRNYSVSQCYQLIWSSAADATDFMVRKATTSQHAANYFVGACQRKADRVHAAGWVIKGFRRNYHLARSQVSYVLHDVFLRHGDAGFTSTVPTP
ncbi:MAG: hypothetical protein H6R07_366 [Proteobacteria bacterium]|nr:hypothetical protein [Pseudomonadota bacterium]